MTDPRFQTGDPAMDAALAADDAKLEGMGAYEAPEFHGWPPTRATVLSFSQFLNNRAVILRRVANGERITLTVSGRRVAMLVKPERP